MIWMADEARYSRQSPSRQDGGCWVQEDAPQGLRHVAEAPEKSVRDGHKTGLLVKKGRTRLSRTRPGCEAGKASRGYQRAVYPRLPWCRLESTIMAW